jgi:hypothetical protein
MDGDRWSNRLSITIKEWSDHVAGLAADALVDAQLISGTEFGRAAAIISEEVFARLCLGDFPPPEEKDLPSTDA